VYSSDGVEELKEEEEVDETREERDDELSNCSNSEDLRLSRCAIEDLRLSRCAIGGSGTTDEEKPLLHDSGM
jgi:hypothetical protein